MNQKSSRPQGVAQVAGRCGTAWTAPGRGAYLATLLRRAGIPIERGDLAAGRTNLRLTGAPFGPYDISRIASCQVER